MAPRGRPRKTTAVTASMAPEATCSESHASWHLVEFLGVRSHDFSHTHSSQFHEEPPDEEFEQSLHTFPNRVNTVDEEVGDMHHIRIDAQVEMQASIDKHLDDCLFLNEEVLDGVIESSIQMTDSLRKEIQSANARQQQADAQGKNAAQAHGRSSQLQNELARAIAEDESDMDSEDEEAVVRLRLESENSLAGVHSAFNMPGGTKEFRTSMPIVQNPTFGMIFQSMREASAFVNMVSAQSTSYRVWQGGSNIHRAWVCDTEMSAAGRRHRADERRKPVATQRNKHGERSMKMMLQNDGCKAVLEVQRVMAKSLVQGTYRRSGFNLVYELKQRMFR